MKYLSMCSISLSHEVCTSEITVSRGNPICKPTSGEHHLLEVERIQMLVMPDARLWNSYL